MLETEKPPAPEPQRIDPYSKRSLGYWASRFRVTVERIEEAVVSVGDDPGLVAEHLGVPWPDEFDGIV